MDFQKYFDNCFYELNYVDLLELSKQDTGALNNVISLIERSCFGVLIYDDKEYIEYRIYFADNSLKLRGFCIDISMKIESQIRVQLLFEFCKVINSEFNHIDVIDSFNIYQKRLRTGFEKLGYFTIGNEVKEFEGKNAVGVVTGKKGVIRFPTLDKLEMYRSIFSLNKKAQKMYDLGQNAVYLLLDERNNLMKIGHSKTLKVRERTLQGQNPKWQIITAWIAPQKIENELHKKYCTKRVRGEWFSLTFYDLKEINMAMKTFEQII